MLEAARDAHKTEFAVLKKEFQHQQETIHDLSKKTSELSNYQIELGLLLKMYMEKMESYDDKLDKFDEKIDKLTTLLQNFMRPDEIKIKENMQQADAIKQMQGKIDLLEAFMRTAQEHFNGVKTRTAILSHVGNNLQVYLLGLSFIGYIVYAIISEDIFKK